MPLVGREDDKGRGGASQHIMSILIAHHALGTSLWDRGFNVIKIESIINNGKINHGMNEKINVLSSENIFFDFFTMLRRNIEIRGDIRNEDSCCGIDSSVAGKCAQCVAHFSSCRI
ncbi:MAG: hypothetical protein QW520_04790 [Methanomassiliicoccales archaeon]